MFAELTLSGSYRETAPQVKSLLRLSSRNTVTHESLMKRCDAIVRDKRITTVLVNTHDTFAAGTPGALESVRSLLERVRDSGREVVFFANEYDDGRLYLASACTTRIIHPLGSLRCTGLARTNLFFRALADRFGVKLQVARRGRYKSAMDRFLLDSVDPANLEQYQRWMDVTVSHLHTAIVEGYGKAQDELEQLLDGEILCASAAVERGWADRAVDPGSLVHEWQEAGEKRRRLRLSSSIGRGRKIAVLFFEGMIATGENAYNPILGQSIGSESFSRHVEALRKDRRVKAVVLRINSGGGSAAASENIRAALARLAREKPLVVSMGEVAGSGGYWIAMTGAPVFAGRTTLTGSIGVITAAAAFGDALAKEGVTHTTIRTHEHADAGQGFRLLSDGELAELDARVESIYHEFLSLVSRHRSLTPSEVDARAQGRIWSGSDARDQNLVDELGGLSEAIDRAQSLASLHRARIIFRPQVKYSLVERLMYSRGRSPAGVAELLASTWPSRAAALTASIGTLRGLVSNPLLLEPLSLPHDRLIDSFDPNLEVE